MGYSSYVASGQYIEFSRPLIASEIRPIQELMSGLGYADYFLRLEVDEEATETDEGTLTKRTAACLTTAGNEGKASGLAKELQDVINALPKDVTASGYIERIGEGFPDAERLHALGRRVISVKAEIVWREPS